MILTSYVPHKDVTFGEMQVILKNIALRYFLFLKLKKETKSGSNYFYIYIKKKPTMLLLGSFAMILGSEYKYRNLWERALQEYM